MKLMGCFFIWVHLGYSCHGKSQHLFSNENQPSGCLEWWYSHYKVMQRSKNRNKAGYLRHCQTHSHLRLHGTQVDDDTWFDRLSYSSPLSFMQVRQEWKTEDVCLGTRSLLYIIATDNPTMHCVSRGGSYLVNSYCDLQEENQWKKESYQACWLSLVLETRPQYK